MAEAHLADLLKNPYNVLEVSNMEHGEYKLDVRIMTDAERRLVAASLTGCRLVDCALQVRP